MTRQQQIRRKMFREMVKNVVTALERDFKIEPSLTLSSLRLMWLTANNCAHLQMGTEAIREFRRQLMI